jgi:membrane-bound acyltransferase YfiQ involved in biofilm formation
VLKYFLFSLTSEGFQDREKMAIYTKVLLLALFATICCNASFIGHGKKSVKWTVQKQPDFHTVMGYKEKY